MCLRTICFQGVIVIKEKEQGSTVGRSCSEQEYAAIHRDLQYQEDQTKLSQINVNVATGAGVAVGGGRRCRGTSTLLQAAITNSLC